MPPKHRIHERRSRPGKADDEHRFSGPVRVQRRRPLVAPPPPHVRFGEITGPILDERKKLRLVDPLAGARLPRQAVRPGGVLHGAADIVEAVADGRQARHAHSLVVQGQRVHRFDAAVFEQSLRAPAVAVDVGDHAFLESHQGMVRAQRVPGAPGGLAQLAVPVRLFQELHQAPVCRRIARIDPQRPPVAVGDATIVPQFPGNLGQRAPGLAVSGLEPDGLFVLFGRLAQEPPVLADQAEVEAGLGEPGIAVDGPHEAARRVLRAAAMEIGDAEAVVGFREAGPDCERRAVALDRGAILAEFETGSPQQAVQNQLVRMRREQAADLLRQGFELSRAVQLEQRSRG